VYRPLIQGCITPLATAKTPRGALPYPPRNRRPTAYFTSISLTDRTSSLTRSRAKYTPLPAG